MSVRIEIVTDHELLSEDIEYLRIAPGVQKLEQSRDNPRQLLLEVWGDSATPDLLTRFRDFIRQEFRPLCGQILAIDYEKNTAEVIGYTDNGRPDPGRIAVTGTVKLNS